MNIYLKYQNQLEAELREQQQQQQQNKQLRYTRNYIGNYHQIAQESAESRKKVSH